MIPIWVFCLCVFFAFLMGALVIDIAHYLKRKSWEDWFESQVNDDDRQTAKDYIQKAIADGFKP